MAKLNPAGGELCPPRPSPIFPVPPSLTRNQRAIILVLVIAVGLRGLQQYQTYQNTYYIGTQAITQDSVLSCAK